MIAEIPPLPARPVDINVSTFTSRANSFILVACSVTAHGGGIQEAVGNRLLGAVSQRLQHVEHGCSAGVERAAAGSQKLCIRGMITIEENSGGRVR